uniref:Ig-like domain-containing protein n=1 Tax=Labrus bergylta TaxID=56723 RepID=A0A3Q3GZ95_9LABR
LRNIQIETVVSLSPDCVCGSELKVTVRPGDNITLYCDCKTSTGVYIVWKRNCSHENQPSLFLRTRFRSVLNSGNNQLSESPGNPFPHYHMVRNQSSESYDLLIMNITGSEEGLYYCGTEETKVEDTDRITHRPVYTYGNVTRIILSKLSLFFYCQLTVFLTDPHNNKSWSYMNADLKGQNRRVIECHRAETRYIFCHIC